jgi:ribosomal protein S18 acetylase RimI-like enzyme
MAREFDLTPELIDQIIFGMENQEKGFVVDTQTLQVLPAEEVDQTAEAERYVDIPDWSSVNGFQLMEKFVTSLRNPLFREMLREALSSGRGVFRKFKDVLKQRPEIERLWFGFKEREMKRVVYLWYNQLREAWGLERIGPEPEDTEELILSDLTIRPETGEHMELIRDLDRRAFFEMFPDSPDAYVRDLYDRRREYYDLALDEDTLLLIAETPAQEFAGFAWGAEESLDAGRTLSRLLQLYVTEEYRGLGLGRALLRRFCGLCAERQVTLVRVELMGASLVMVDVFRTEGFSPFSETLEMDVSGWRVSNLAT